MRNFAARYEVRFINDRDPARNFHRVTACNSLLRAAAARVTSGDLVVDMLTGKVVEDDAWLFDWEKTDPTCYARRMQGRQIV